MFKNSLAPLTIVLTVYWVKTWTPGGFSTLVLVGTCHCKFESGPIQIPIFGEKVTHSYTKLAQFLGQILTKLPDFIKIFLKGHWTSITPIFLDLIL